VSYDMKELRKQIHDTLWSSGLVLGPDDAMVLTARALHEVSEWLSKDEPHIIDIQGNGWCIEHPFACRRGPAQLRDCGVHKAARRDLGIPGVIITPRRYECSLDSEGRFILGKEVYR
jgi:hypothetical protein